MYMPLSALLTPDRMITDLQAHDRWQAIDELLTRLNDTGAVEAQDRNAISAVVRKREQTMSTGVGFGIGIPHATTNCVAQAVAALGRSAHGIAFDALDGLPVNLVVLFLVPQGQIQQHLHTMAGIARLLQRAEVRQALLQAPDAMAMLQIIQQLETPGSSPGIQP
jgi:mannitol/fructose-specific phosphotransferase system IIA component (Ntr-type)